MNLSSEAIDALLKAARTELSRWDADVEDVARMVRSGRDAEKPMLERWQREAEQLRSALLELTAYSDAAKRRSR